MNQQPYNAQTAEEMWQEFKEQQAQPKKQTDELQKQTSILSEVCKLTAINVKVSQDLTEHTEKLVECTKENQKTANKQFLASIIVSVAALIIAFASFCVSVIK